MKKDKDLPLISVIMPCYNQYEYLERSILSVTNQNYPKIELIIIDGGSTDGSLDIILKYKNKIAYWVSERDNGQSHALNKGFKVAKGDLIGWQNSDDTYLPNAFWDVAKTWINEPDYEIYYGNIFHIDENDKIINKCYFTPFNFNVWKYHDINIANQAIFFTKKIKDDIHINEDFRYAMDANLYFQLANKKYRFHFTNRFWGCFRIQSASKTSNLRDVSLLETKKIRLENGVKFTSFSFRIKRFKAIAYVIFMKLIYGGFAYAILKRINKW